MDRDGRPVTDAAAAVNALLVPIGGYKGYGIALMIDLLTAGLAGGPAGAAVGSPYDFGRPQGVSHFMIALDPAAFGGAEELAVAVQGVAGQIRGAPRQPGISTIYLPGDLEWKREPSGWVSIRPATSSTVSLRTRVPQLGQKVWPTRAYSRRRKS